MKFLFLPMSSVARSLPQQHNNYYNALQSSLRTLSHNAFSYDSNRAFKPYNPLRASQSSTEPQTLNKTKNNKGPINISNEPPGQAPWSLDTEDRIPIKSSLPFDFQYSYSESNPDLIPIAYREKKFSPFGPGRIDRTWTGWSAPAPAPLKENADNYKKNQSEILGEPLTEEEMAELAENYGRSKCDRQINLGRGGVTHNMLVDIHNHWKRAEAVRIKCLGVPTINMDNVCFHLEYNLRLRAKKGEGQTSYAVLDLNPYSDWIDEGVDPMLIADNIANLESGTTE